MFFRTRASLLILIISCTLLYPPSYSHVHNPPDDDKKQILYCKSETSLDWMEITKDLALACGVTYFLTLIHELGHAFTAKLLLNSPVDVVIGSHTKDTIYAQVPGIALGGFSPHGAAYVKDLDTIRDVLHHPYPLKAAAIGMAGPLSGALASYIIFKKTPSDFDYPLYSQENKLPFTKIMSLLLIFAHVFNLVPFTYEGHTLDGKLIITALKAYFNRT